MNTGMRYAFGRAKAKGSRSLYELDELSGDAIDSISGFNATVNGNVTQGASGVFGNCYDFNGGFLDSGVDFFTSKNFSIVWNESPSQNSLNFNYHRFSYNFSGFGNQNSFFVGTNNDMNFRIGFGGVFNTTITPLINEFNEYAIIVNNNNLNFYRNKILLESYTINNQFNPNGSNFFIGKREGTQPRPFIGKLDRINFFRYAITEQELNNI